MAIPPTGNPTGRPQKEIDWNHVDFLLCAHCSGTEIADCLDMHYQTFYDRVKEKFGLTFTEFAAKKHSKGKGLLRGAQLKKALSGNPQMLVWMGKQLLKQKDTIESNMKEEDIGKLQVFIDLLSGKQTEIGNQGPTFPDESESVDLKISDSNTSNE
jgi:hypothetical protein